MNRTALALAVAFLVLAGCSSSNDPDPSTTPALHGARQTSVASVTQDGLTVELFTDTQLETGLTPVWVSVKNAAGQPVTGATVALMPMMHMDATATTPAVEHSAPTFGCAPMAAEGDGFHHCDVVFQMMTMSGTWRADLTINAGAAPVTVSFPIVVAACASATPGFVGCAAAFSYPSTAPVAEQTKYVASLNFLAPIKVGLNPVALTLHTRSTDMMSFPPVEGAVITLDPQMPSMGHGSPGSVNPTMTSPGLYEGQLSFSMDGDWVTTVTVAVNGAQIGTLTFKTTF
jgi:YtkA-like protein